MANKDLFSPGRIKAKPDTINEAGGIAYSMPPDHALAQLVMTGTLSNVYYTSAPSQLEEVQQILPDVAPEFVLKLAVYARKMGYLKDMPALLMSWLAVHHSKLYRLGYPHVIDNPKMIRNLLQMLRSGVLKQADPKGRRSGKPALPQCVRKTVRKSLNEMPVQKLFDETGKDPSIADVIRMVHPKPADDERSTLFLYLCGWTDNPNYNVKNLPKVICDYEDYKSKKLKRKPVQELSIPQVSFQRLDSLGLDDEEWAEVVKIEGYHFVYKNLNTFLRHKIYSLPGVTEFIAERLREKETIKTARVMPYQLMTALLNLKPGIPMKVKLALQDALELSLSNVPEISGCIVLAIDVSGSMSHPVTGYRGDSTTKTRCVDVAALIASALLRKNPDATVVVFYHLAEILALNPRDSVVTNTQHIIDVLGGRTSVSEPLALINRQHITPDLVVLVSDLESWHDSRDDNFQQTALVREWNKILSRNKNAKLACIDIAPYTTTQIPDRKNTFNFGGFSDAVFELLSCFYEDKLGPEYWISEIDKIDLNAL